MLSQYGNYMPLPTLLPDLMRFKQGGDWDAQRIGGKNVIEYRDYATIAIGLYAAAADVPVDDILARQNDCAHLFSRFGAKTPMDSVYTHLPQRNVRNTKFGYDLFQSGRISGGRP